MPIYPNRCKQHVFEDRGGGHQCFRNSVRDGYCKQHHPDAVAARNEDWQARYKACRLRDQWRARCSELRNLIADAAIAHQSHKSIEVLVSEYEEHLKHEPPKPA